MTRSSPTLSKLSRPKLFRVVGRGRLFKLLDEKRKAHPGIWVTGPPGAGKTALIGSYLDVSKLPGIWYQIDSGDNDPASFFYYLALAARKAAGQKRLSLPLLTPEYLLDLPGFTRRFFRILFTALPSNATLVLDNYQEASTESAIHRVIQGAIAETCSDINLIVLSRLDPPPQYARELANNLITQIGWEELRLTLPETIAIATNTGAGSLAAQTLQTLQDQTNGWAAGLVLMMERLKRTGEINHISRSETMSFVFNYFAGQIFDQASTEMREFLMCTAILPRMTVEMANDISTNAKAGEFLDDLYRRRLFTDRRAGENISYHYHALFREFLLDRGVHHLSPAKLHDLKYRGALLAKQNGEVEAAAQILAEIEEWGEFGHLISDQAAELLAQGRHRTLQGFISMLPQAIYKSRPWLIYWRGLAQLPFNPVEARGTLEHAYLEFCRLDDSLGMYSSWAGVMNTFFFEFQDFTPVDRWIAEFEQLQMRHPEFPSPAIELRTYLAMGALMHRQHQHPLLRTWSERCLSLLDDADDDVAILLGGHLVLNFSYWGKTVIVRRVIDQLNPKIHLRDISRMTYIFWFSALAAYYAWLGETDTCLKCVNQGLQAAEENGLHFFDFILYGQAATCCLTTGDLAQAEAWISLMTGNIQSHNYIENGFYHHLQSNAAAQHGKWQQSAEHARAGVAMVVKAGTPLLEAIIRVDLARALIDQGDNVERSENLTTVQTIAKDAGMPALEYLCYEVSAVAAFKHGKEAEGMQYLTQALALSRIIDGAAWLLRGPKVSSDLYNRALIAGIETDHVRQMIRRYRLNPPDPLNAAESWPWPVQVYTLGRFEVLCNGEPVRSSAKAPRKPLELLKCLCAFGGKSVNQSRLTDALWPDAEGDIADQAFRTTLHRLRKLLQCEEAVRMEDCHLSLNPNYVWADCLAFDYTAHHWDEVDRISLQRALNNYQGHFLEGETAHWALSFRDRLRSAYQNAAEQLGLLHEQNCDWQAAINCYRKAIEIQPTSESFYRRLMNSYKQNDQRTEALAVYQRCRQSLLTHLGVSPNPQTQLLYQTLLDS